MFKNLIKAYLILRKKDQKKIFFLLVTMVFSALMELVGVALVFPFMSILINPKVIFDKPILHSVYIYFNFSSVHNFLFFSGFLALIALILGNAISALNLYSVLKFSNLQEYYLSKRLLTIYLKKPYAFFLVNNTSKLLQNIFSEISSLTNEFIIPAMEMLSRLILVIFVSLFLLLFNPLMAVIIVVSVGGSYFLVALILKNSIKQKGKIRIHSDEVRYKIATESLSGIRDTKLFCLEDYMIQRYAVFSKQFVLARADARVFSQLPRFLPEVIAFGGILIFLLISLYEGTNLTSVVPIIATYAFAGIRLMPSIHFIYNGSSLVRFSLPVLDKISRIFESEKENLDLENNDEKMITALKFSQSIILKNCSFYYQNKKQPVLSDLNMRIPYGSKIGIVGESGAGKSTLVDILTGLLHPASGFLKIDGVNINASNVRAWQALIGYVSQSVYLIDDTIAANIAFGVEKEEIDYNLLKKSARIAELEDFILTELPDGYETYVGDRGTRLSGGQKQRVGIARALYRNPKLLVLDEATSALDRLTEEKVIHNIAQALKNCTVIIIAHRLSTIQHCDKIYVLKKGGKIESCGTYFELMETSAIFKSFLKAGRKINPS